MGLEPIRNLDFSGSLSSGNFSVTSSNSETEVEKKREFFFSHVFQFYRFFTLNSVLQSSISFFNDRSITLGSLIGFTSIVKTESLSLGYFLEVERRASNSSSLEKKPSSSSCLLCLCYSV